MLSELAVGRISESSFPFRSLGVLPGERGPYVASDLFGLNFDTQTRSSFLNSLKTGEHVAILINTHHHKQNNSYHVNQVLC